MERFTTIVYDLKRFDIATKRSILDVWRDPGYTSELEAEAYPQST